MWSSSLVSRRYKGQINQWGTFLASHGFVVMMVDTAANGAANTGVQPPARATGLMEAVTTLKGENTRSGSPLVGKLDTARIAIMGHSMGGGGTLLAANTHPELKAAIGLCPWNPGVTYPTDTVPSLFFDGTADVLVSPAAATAEYQSIPTTTPKVYAEFNGGTHFVANTPLGTAASDEDSGAHRALVARGACRGRLALPAVHREGREHVGLGHEAVTPDQGSRLSERPEVVLHDYYRLQLRHGVRAHREPSL